MKGKSASLCPIPSDHLQPHVAVQKPRILHLQCRPDRRALLTLRTPIAVAYNEALRYIQRGCASW